MTERRRISSGGPWEKVAGYSRAVRVGDSVWVSGSTSAASDGSIRGVDDPGSQTRYALETVAAALKKAGASLEDVVRTRMYVTDMEQWEEVIHAHGKVFGEIRPASTIVEVTRLIHPDLLVEIEAEARLTESAAPPEEGQPPCA